MDHHMEYTGTEKEDSATQSMKRYLTIGFFVEPAGPVRKAKFVHGINYPS